jgi:circadian clock protein KaiC
LRNRVFVRGSDAQKGYTALTREVIVPVLDDPKTIERRENLPKVSTGNVGLDKILLGGIPAGRTTLLSGGPGCGKTLVGLEYLVRGAQAGEPGILVPFEERTDAIRANALTLGWDLAALERDQKLAIVNARIDRGTLVSGSFDLQGMLAIIEGLARDLGATRLVLDAIDILLRYYDNPAREREQLFLLHDWLIERGFTTILTVKRSGEEAGIRQYEFMDYLADCVLHLDQRVAEQVTTRRIRVVKYRGSDSGHNEYPYVTTPKGVRIIPISDIELRHIPLTERMTSGHPVLDDILGGGYFRGSSILIAGPSGTGKTTLASVFMRAACARKERVLFVGFEESPESIVQSMLSSGTDLRSAVESGALYPITAMPEALGAEEHLMRILGSFDQFRPHHVVVDAVSAAVRIGSGRTAFELVVRLLNACRGQGSTAILLNQTIGIAERAAIAGEELSSLVDAILHLRFVEIGGETNRVLSILKSRGTAHSNQLREFRITSQGIDILPVFGGAGGVVTGAARQEQEMREAAEARQLVGFLVTKRKEIARRRAELAAETARMAASIEEAESELANMELEVKESDVGRSVRSRMRQAKFVADEK